MIYNEAIGIIELGNIKIKCVIFKIKNDNSSEILSTSSCDSAGIHNGVVINLSKASDVIRSCISAAEKKAEVSLKRINVGLAGRLQTNHITKLKSLNPYVIVSRNLQNPMPLNLFFGILYLLVLLRLL